MNELIKRFFDSPWVELGARWVLGIVFLAACFHKIINPAQFAKVLYGYQLVPGTIVNLIAIILPFLELYAGAALLLCIYPRSAALLVNLMLLAFVIAISINLIRGHEFDCGCFSMSDTQGPRAAVKLLVRDLACLVAGVIVMRFQGRLKWCAGNGFYQ